MNQFKVVIDICSNCNQHKWCTRHKENHYNSLADELKKRIMQVRENVEVEINHVGGSKIGSFEVFCKDINLFSKLSLGYFPHIKLLAERIENFMQDVEKGNDLTSYKECNSPVRRKSNIKRSGSVSPVKPTTIKTYNGQSSRVKNEQQVQQKMQLKVQQKSDPKIEQKNDPKIDKKSETKIDHHVQQKSEQKIEHKVKIKSEAKIDQIQRKSQGKIDQKIQHKVEKKSQLKIEQKVGHKQQLNNEKKTLPQSNKKLVDNHTVLSSNAEPVHQSSKKVQATHKATHEVTHQQAQEGSNEGSEDVYEEGFEDVKQDINKEVHHEVSQHSSHIAQKKPEKVFVPSVKTSIKTIQETHKVEYAPSISANKVDIASHVQQPKQADTSSVSKIEPVGVQANTEQPRPTEATSTNKVNTSTTHIQNSKPVQIGTVNKVENIVSAPKVETSSTHIEAPKPATQVPKPEQSIRLQQKAAQNNAPSPAQDHTISNSAAD